MELLIELSAHHVYEGYGIGRRVVRTSCMPSPWGCSEKCTYIMLAQVMEVLIELRGQHVMYA